MTASRSAASLCCLYNVPSHTCSINQPDTPDNTTHTHSIAPTEPNDLLVVVLFHGFFLFIYFFFCCFSLCSFSKSLHQIFAGSCESKWARGAVKRKRMEGNTFVSNAKAVRLQRDKSIASANGLCSFFVCLWRTFCQSAIHCLGGPYPADRLLLFVSISAELSFCVRSCVRAAAAAAHWQTPEPLLSPFYPILACLALLSLWIFKDPFVQGTAYWSVMGESCVLYCRYIIYCDLWESR